MAPRGISFSPRGLAESAAAACDRLDAPAARPGLLLVGLWLILITPLLFLRGAHFEDGTVIALARGAVEDGHWLTPHLYGVRFTERPVMLSWLIALINWPLGRVDAILARVPTIIAVLSGAALVYWFVRRYANPAAGLFGACCFILSPLVLQRLVTAEPDILLSVLLFAAFVVWWIGHEAGQVSVSRWLAVGALAGLAGLTKGPQPCAYLFLGIGAFLLLRRRWSEIAGLIFAGLVASAMILAWYVSVYVPGDLALWRSHGRLGAWMSWRAYFGRSAWFVLQIALSALPATIVLLPLLNDARLRAALAPRRDLITALSLFAGVTTLLLIFWPETATRYAMPGLLALAVIGGLAFAPARLLRPRIAGAAVLLAAGLALYQVIAGWVVLPFTRNVGAMNASAVLIEKTLSGDRLPLYVPYTDTLPKNAIVFVRAPVRALPTAKLPDMSLPAWALLTPGELADLKSHRNVSIVSQTPVERIGRLLVRLDP